MTPRPTVTIILPVYNQADHLEEAVMGYVAELRNVPAEVELLLIVNGSSDGSVEIARGLAERERHVRVVDTEERGWGRAVRLGLREARGDLICYTNLARTSARDLVLLVVYATVYPHVVVKANRRIRDGWFRRLGSLLFNLECRALFDLSQWDINGTPKVFPRGFEQLLKLERDDDLIDAEFNVVCRREGYAMLEVPIFSSRRYGGRSTTGIGSALRLYWGAYALRRQLRTADAP